MNCGFLTRVRWARGCTNVEMLELASDCSTLLPGNRAVLLDGMTKKRDDIPDAALTRLRALQAAVNAELKNPKKGH